MRRLRRKAKYYKDPHTSDFASCICKRRGIQHGQLHIYRLHLLIPIVGVIAALVVWWHFQSRIDALMTLAIFLVPIALLTLGRMLFRHSVGCALRWANIKLLELLGEMAFQALINLSFGS
jgi:cell division protein FtsW (lipid II flippase)